MEVKLPLNEGRQTLAEAERAARAPARVAVVKTKAEQALAEGYAAIADALPGGDGARDVRERAIGRFESLGLPHRRIEAWKYTDLRQLPASESAGACIATCVQRYTGLRLL
jgi:hypothetical protein